MLATDAFGNALGLFELSDITTELFNIHLNNLELNYQIISNSFEIRDKINVFARYDLGDPWTESVDDSNTNDLNEGEDNSTYLIAGIVLTCDGGISIAPNVRMTNYENTAKESESEYKVNFQFKF